MSKYYRQLAQHLEKRISPYEPSVSRFMDKYSVVKRLYQLGILLNIFIIYRNCKVIGTLKGTQQFISQKKQEFRTTQRTEKDMLLSAINEN